MGKESEDLRGGLTHRTTADPYRAKKRTANAAPSGGGGGGWAEANKTMAENRAKLQAKAIGTQGWVQDKIEDGDIDGGMSAGQSGTSIFDPVLCEIAYRWFCPPTGTVLDPFAGGSVRGIVASRLGRKYVGIELRPEQIAANRAQLGIAGEVKPDWREGDSRDISKLAKDVRADLVFSCPPYWNLEVYSEDPRDVSNMGSGDFFSAMETIIAGACGRLRDHRFAVWVVGDVRDADGCYINLPGRSVQAFEKAGLRLYNEAILITAMGSLPIRINKQFSGSRKLGKTHQNVLVFVKGDPRKATEAIGAVEFGEVEGAVDTSLPALNLNIGGAV
jgi:DNA methylase